MSHTHADTHTYTNTHMQGLLSAHDSPQPPAEWLGAVRGVYGQGRLLSVRACIYIWICTHRWKVYSEGDSQTHAHTHTHASFDNNICTLKSQKKNPNKLQRLVVITQ